MNTMLCDAILLDDQITGEQEVCGAPATWIVTSPEWSEKYGCCDDCRDEWDSNGAYLRWSRIEEAA